MLGPRVAAFLIERGWVNKAQIDEALRTQGFFGGQLESHLLKLGYVSEAVLGEALTEIAGVPFASWEHLRAVPQSVIDALPERLAEKFRVCPFRLDEGRLRVALLNPRDAVALREIQSATGHVVEPWITTEPRLYQALERYYRLRIAGTKGISLRGPRPPDRPQPQEASVEPAGHASEIGLDGRPLDAEVNLEEYYRRPVELLAEPAVPPLPAPPRAEAAPPSPRSAIEPQRPAPAAAPDTLVALSEALARASNRDELAEALLSFCAGRASRAGLFAVGRDGVRGIAGRGRSFDTARLRGVVAAPGTATIFDTALQSRDFYFGVVPAMPANRDLYTALGGRLPANVMLLPIVVKERTVALLYLDGDDGPMVRPDIPTMRRVAAKTGLAYELLLLRNKLLEI